MPTLRPFQQEDVNAVLDAHKSYQCVIGRAATGLGKACELAALAHHYSQFGRVIVLVDVTKLVEQLAETIKWFTGISPGVEMADSRAYHGDGFNEADRIVVSTVQTQYSGEAGNERYRKFDPNEVSCVLLDECELFLAPSARSVVEWYRQNKSLRVFGCTATPMRTDGVAMGELFEHVAFDRDILWGIAEGWLVPARQAFVRVSIDFSTLKVRAGEDGESDFSESEVAERINNEATLIELAKGIVHVCEDRKSIIVCPDVASARAVAHYLCAERAGSAKCVYGEMSDDDKRDVMAGHRRGDFQYLSSVMMLTKGYDDAEIRAVVNCRKTKSKRLYQQILGRGTRPLKGTLEGIETAAERRAVIAASKKCQMLMVNMVGVSDDVRDCTLVDILGNVDDVAIAERAKEIAQENEVDTEEAIEIATEEIEDERQQAAIDAEKAAADLDAEDELRLIRSRIQVKAHVDVEYENDLRIGGMAGDGLTESRIPQRQLTVLQKAKVPDDVIAKLSPEQAKSLSREVVRRWKKGLCSYRQADVLKRAGYTRDELRDMSREVASAAMDQIKTNHWKRVEVMA